MAHAINDGVSIRYEIEAGASADGEAVVWCGDVGFGAWQFGWQHAAVAGPHTTVTPEVRGIGDSAAPPGPYDVETLVADIDAVCAAASIRDAHLVGYGLGGMVALAYAHASGRPASVTLVGTPAAGDAYDAAAVWADPNDAAALERSTASMVSASFTQTHPAALEQIEAWRSAEDADRTVFEAHRAAVAGFDMRGCLHEVTTPALVICGSTDGVCPAAAAASLANGLPRGEYHEIDGAGHLVGVEAAAAVNDHLVGWLSTHTADPV